MVMAKWSSSDTGILRKKNQKDKHEDLLVFGYACKLFRDDEKALYIDQGKHLIPWMDNDKLRIDRYDGRGALSELTPYESSREGYDTMRWLGLSESERKLEQLCDEERYSALHTNEDDELLYKEEEAKRSKQKEKEFSYSYDVSPDPNTKQQSAPTVEEEEKTFVAPPELDVPVDIPIPKTVKENARIEKTAIFVSQQGPQMEILIKAKQSDNPQFSFMNQTDPLFKYYRHLLSAIKSGRYKVTDMNNKKESDSETKESDNGEDHYLHPSLLTSASTLAAPPVVAQIPTAPQISYKPSADCAYSQLVNRIQGSQSDGLLKSTPPTIAPTAAATTTTAATANPMTYEQQQQYYQYYYTMQYYEYYKQMSQYQGQNRAPGESNEDAPPQPDQQNPLSYTQFLKQHTNPYAQIVNNIASNKELVPPPPSSSTEIVDKNSANSDISKAAVIYGPPNLDSANFIGPLKLETRVVTALSEDVPQLKSLVHYGTDSDSSESHANEEIEEPPADTKTIVDKMASYVSKNGTSFEAIVKSKGDPRFEFLHDSHRYHAYYKAKIKEFSGETVADAASKPSPIKEDEGSAKELPEKERAVKAKEKKIIAPVSFSIKKPKEHDGPKDIKSALPMEESDDETNNVEAESMTPPPPPEIQQQEQEEVGDQPIAKEASPKSDAKSLLVDVDDPILEMIDLTDDVEEKRDAKRAEDRIKDKLAAAAREKLASATRDRALQLERKKRAAAFLKLKSADGGQKDELEIRSVSKVDDVHTISDSDKDETDRTIISTASKSGDNKRERDRRDDVDEGKRHKRSSKKRKSHRRRSKSKHDYNRHKKSKKRRRRRSDSYTSNSSNST